MVEDRLRRHSDYCLGKTEIVIYSVLAVLLAVTVFGPRLRWSQRPLPVIQE